MRLPSIQLKVSHSSECTYVLDNEVSVFIYLSYRRAGKVFKCTKVAAQGLVTATTTTTTTTSTGYLIRWKDKLTRWLLDVGKAS